MKFDYDPKEDTIIMDLEGDILYTNSLPMSSNFTEAMNKLEGGRKFLLKNGIIVYKTKETLEKIYKEAIGAEISDHK